MDRGTPCSPWGHKELDTTERLTHTEYSAVWIQNLLFLHSLVDTHLDSFHFGDIMNDAIIKNIYVYIFVWTYVFSSLGYIPRSGIAGLYGNSDISRNHQRPNSRCLGKVGQGQKADE